MSLKNEPSSQLQLLLSSEGSEMRGGAPLLPDHLAFLPAEFEDVLGAFGTHHQPAELVLTVLYVALTVLY